MVASNRSHPIRFGLQVGPSVEEIETIGAEAEAAGFDVITVADHIGADRFSPLIVLSRLAASTSTIGLGTMVLNNDMRNPVQLAWEAATLQELSGGRFELGLGAGHTPHEYAATGIAFDPPAVRKQRLSEAVEIISALGRGEAVDREGGHYTVRGAELTEPGRPVPILVGGNGAALLTHAARHAQAIGLQGLGRTMEDGHRHSVRFEIDHLEAQLATIDEAAVQRSDEAGPLELAALVQVTEIADDREAALAPMVERIEGLTMADALAAPYLAVGTVDEMAAQFIAARDRWGISYFTVRSMDIAPVMAKVHAHDQAS
jgi:probable F420-dependent oxidoreductase